MAQERGDVAHEAGVRRQQGVQPGVGAGVHKTKASSWVTVLLIIASSIILGLALILLNLPLAIVGAVVGLAGLVVGVTGKILDDAH